jgi:hypothetical protein
LLETIVALLPSLENVIVIVAELLGAPVAAEIVPACVGPTKSNAAIAARTADTGHRLSFNAPAGAKEFCRISPPRSRPIPGARRF